MAQWWTLVPVTNSKEANNLCCLLNPESTCFTCGDKWCSNCYDDSITLDDRIRHVWKGTFCTASRYNTLGGHQMEKYEG